MCYKLGDAAPVYALEGSVAVTGSAVQWLRDQLGIIGTAAEVEALANTVPDNGGAYFVPAFSGLFAPYWRADARGAIVGLSRFNNKGHLARATLEAICFQTRAVLDAMTIDSGVTLAVLKVDGGATVNDTLMQLQADVLGVPVVRPVVAETTALGAAYAAGLAVGFWKRSRNAAEKLAGGSAVGTNLEHRPPRGGVSRMAEGGRAHAELGRSREGVMVTMDESAKEKSLIGWTQLIYGLHAFSLLTGILGAATVIGAFLTGWPSIIAVILNYVKRGDVRGTWLESHFRWQIRTFWFGLLWISLCVLFILFTFGIGILIAWLPIGIVSLWFIYRIARGWLALNDRKAMDM